MQEAAKAKEAAKRAREAEVFILNPQGAATTHTVPKPFKLHGTTNQVTVHPQIVFVRRELNISWLCDAGSSQLLPALLVTNAQQ